MRLAILISNAGTGTNLQAIIDGVYPVKSAESGTAEQSFNRVKNNKIKAEICAVVSDKEDAQGLERAREHNIKTVLCQKKEDLLTLLNELKPDYICLAGWKQIILDEVILAFPNKILNLHPGLIPDTLDGITKNPDGTKGLWNKGLLTTKAIQNFLDQKATFAGSSIHFLTLEFDFGPVLGRTFEKIQVDDTVETLYKRLKVKENNLYVDVLQKLTT